MALCLPGDLPVENEELMSVPSKMVPFDQDGEYKRSVFGTWEGQQLQ